MQQCSDNFKYYGDIMGDSGGSPHLVEIGMTSFGSYVGCEIGFHASFTRFDFSIFKRSLEAAGLEENFFGGSKFVICIGFLKVRSLKNFICVSFPSLMISGSCSVWSVPFQ